MKKIVIRFLIIIVLLIAVAAVSITTGSIKVGLLEFIQGMFSGTNEKVDIIKDLRLPRILVSLVVGAVLAVSGVLLQAVMRNPLADAGVIGISAGASVFSLLMLSLFPILFYWLPLFAFIGGALAWLIVYSFSWKSGLSPVRMLLVGVAVNASFTGIGQLLTSMSRSSITSSNPVTSSTFSFQTWEDVQVIVIYGSVGLLLAWLLSSWCNLLGMQDKTARNLGLNVTRARWIISAVAVLLASAAAAIGGLLAFVGLLIPPIARRALGSDHKLLIPFSALAGALLVLLADTLGRTVIAPIEIPASVILTVVGGPCLLFFLRKSGRLYGN
jgi:iron complex transport system permease protein